MRIFLVATFLVTSLCYATPRVELSLHDMNGRALTTVSAGVPFQLEVAVVDVEEQFSAPVVRGIQQFVRGPVSSSSHFTIMNGQRSSRRAFTSVVRADTVGTFTVGPARIRYQNVSLESNVLKVTVVPVEQVASGTVKNQPAVVTVTTDKKKIFVGEPVWATVTLLHEQDARLQAPLTLDAEKAGFVLGKQLPATTRQVLVDGKNYVSIEQKIELYSHEPGTKTIPSVAAQCQMPPRRQAARSFFDLDDFFGRRVEVFTAASVPVSVEVEPLPASSAKAEFVGEVRSYAARLESPHAKVGEGVVLKVVLEGKGNEKNCSRPELELPDGLTSYESKMTTEERGEGWQKTFEYVVQASRAGDYVIPSQKLYYFDVARKRYALAATEPLTLTAVGRSSATRSEKQEQAAPAEQEPGPAEPVEAPLAAVEESATVFDRLPAIPRRLFFYLHALLILLAVTAAFVLRRYSGSPKKKAFAKARALLATYKKNNDATKLYQLMMHLCAEAVVASSSEQAVVEFLEKVGAGQEAINSWQRDVALFAEASFGSRDVANRAALFDAATYWINKFEKWS